MRRERPLAYPWSATALGALFLVLRSASAALAEVPRFDHIAVIVLENKSYDQVRTQPFTADMIATGTVFTASYAITHPSQPNYIALWAGSTLGVVNNTCPAPGSPFSAENLGHACEAAGVTWKAYSEDLPAAGSLVCNANFVQYTRKHDPWTNFSNLNHMNEVPFGDLATDIANGTLPNLLFLIPNNCNNSHNTGCSVALADSWVAQQVPPLLAAMGSRGMVLLTWDEDDDFSGNHILTVMKGPRVKSGYATSQHVTHYTILRMLCEALGLTPFGAAATEASITDTWAPIVGTESTTFGTVKSLYR